MGCVTSTTGYSRTLFYWLKLYLLGKIVGIDIWICTMVLFQHSKNRQSDSVKTYMPVLVYMSQPPIQSNPIQSNPFQISSQSLPTISLDWVSNTCWCLIRMRGSESCCFDEVIKWKQESQLAFNNRQVTRYSLTQQAQRLFAHDVLVSGNEFSHEQELRALFIHVMSLWRGRRSRGHDSQVPVTASTALRLEISLY